MQSYFFQTAFVAFGSSFLISPVVGQMARSLGIVDKPDQQRKFHARTVPLVGGFVIFASILFATMFAGLLRLVDISEILPLLGGMGVIVAVGILDDRFVLGSRSKLIGQILAVACVMLGGVGLSGLSVFGFAFDLGSLELPIYGFLLLATINAFNFLDGADAFALSIGLVTAVALFALAVSGGMFLEAVIAAGLAGALIGFLVFNFPPASMFLGDSGSMLVGLTIGVLVFRVGAPAGEPIPLGVALSLLAIPCIDTVAAIARRLLTGRSVALGDRAHLHHCLSRRGFGPRRIVVAAALLACIPMCGVAWYTLAQQQAASWLGLLALGAVLVGGRIFGGNELKLLLTRMLGWVRPFIRRRRARLQRVDARSRQVRLGLQRSRECTALWRALTKFADEHDLSRVRLHLSGSWMDDGFDVLWEHVSANKGIENWSTKFPIYSSGRLFGNVELSGAIVGNSGQHILEPLGTLLEQNVPRVDKLFYDVARRAVAAQLGEKNRVLFINRSYWPDCEATGQLLTELCEGLATEFEVSVLVGQPNHMTHAQSYRATGTQHRNNVDIYRVAHTTFSKRTMLGKAINLVSFTASALWKVFWVPKHEVIVVETDPFLLALVGGLVKKLRGGKLVVYMQDVYPDVATEIGKVRPGLVTRVIGQLMQKALSSADEIIVLGEDMKRRLVSHGIEDQKITRIPNWIDTSVVYPVKEENAFRQKFGFNDKFVVMHSGNMGLTQELDHIIEVAKLLKDRKDIEFVFVGNGASRSRLEGKAQELKLNNVHFLPYQPREELAISLSAADLHLVSMHPNITGCLVPSKLYGIMASGTPVLAVVPDDSDVWDIVNSERIGVAVRPGEVSAIKAAIECCANGDVDLASMGERARDLAVTRFDRQHGRESFARMLDAYVERNPEGPFRPLRSEDRHQIPAPYSTGRSPNPALATVGSESVKSA